MAMVRRLGPDDWETYRAIRLRALADAPDAFGSTLERESAFEESDWRQRLGGTVVVVEEMGTIAIGGLFVDDDNRSHVWGMWTDPAHRGRGHARSVLDAVLAPVLESSGEAELHVNVANDAACTTYARYGFVRTGELSPLRPGSDQLIERMVLTGRAGTPASR